MPSCGDAVAVAVVVAAAAVKDSSLLNTLLLHAAAQPADSSKPLIQLLKDLTLSKAPAVTAYAACCTVTRSQHLLLLLPLALQQLLVYCFHRPADAVYTV
jgi:hypothetical protein